MKQKFGASCTYFFLSRLSLVFIKYLIICLIKIQNFKKNPNKLNYIYVLTPKGISQKTKLTINFMKRKMKEYDELKQELDT